MVGGFRKRSTRIATRAFPCAAVEAEGDQGIVLILIQIEVIVGGELVDLLVDGVQPIPQNQVSLCRFRSRSKRWRSG